MYSFVAVIFIVLTYGMETAFFRYSELEKNSKKVFSTSLISLGLTTGLFLLFVLFFPSDIARWIKYPGYENFIIWLGLIISFDVLSAIPFAKLRSENRPARFATIKLINISVNIALNLFFILLCPYILHNYNSGFFHDFISFIFNPKISLISYVFISNLAASALTLLLLLPEVLRIKLVFDLYTWKNLIKYGYPLLFAGLAGVMNETLGRILIRYLLPEDIAEAQLGIYSACYKIAILMALFIQAFRYAAEPFFFSYAEKTDSKKVYSMIMKYFVIASSVIFLGITMFQDIVILLIGKDFRSGENVIPVLLVAYIFLGIYYNLSVWFKLTNKTKYGALMAIIGAAVTVVFNLLWIPTMGYTGSAWATLLCFGTMMIISFLLMKKYYPVKYDMPKILFYLGLPIALFYVSKLLNLQENAFKLGVNFVFFASYILLVIFVERKNLKKMFISK